MFSNRTANKRSSAQNQSNWDHSLWHDTIQQWPSTWKVSDVFSTETDGFAQKLRNGSTTVGRHSRFWLIFNGFSRLLHFIAVPSLKFSLKQHESIGNRPDMWLKSRRNEVSIE
jgi:hypothetical protein